MLVRFSAARCGGSAGTFDFFLFSDGTGTNTATGDFTFDALTEGCRFAQLEDGSFLDVEYSRRLHWASSIERFADALRQALGAIADAPPAGFALAMVDAAALSRVADLLADMDDE